MQQNVYLACQDSTVIQMVGSSVVYFVRFVQFMPIVLTWNSNDSRFVYKWLLDHLKCACNIYLLWASKNWNLFLPCLYPMLYYTLFKPPPYNVKDDDGSTQLDKLTDNIVIFLQASMLSQMTISRTKTIHILQDEFT